MRSRLCPSCSRFIPATQERCARCKTQHSRQKRAARPDLHDSGYKHARREFITAHVQRMGWYCPGDEQHPAHPVTKASDLTIDHINPIADRADQTNWRILCRSRNSARRP